MSITEMNASEINAEATEAVAVQAEVQEEVQPEPAAEVVAAEPAPKLLPWEPTSTQIEMGKVFIEQCMKDGLVPHPRGVYQTMFVAYND